MRTVAVIVCAIVISAVSVLSWVETHRVGGQISEAADRLIQQTEVLKGQATKMLTIQYTAATGRIVTVTTNVGDQQDGEPADLFDRHDQRLTKALQKWPE